MSNATNRNHSLLVMSGESAAIAHGSHGGRQGADYIISCFTRQLRDATLPVTIGLGSRNNTEASEAQWLVSNPPRFSITSIEMEDLPLRDIRVVSLAVNLPGPLTAARLTALGAKVIKVNPPQGDPLAWVSPVWHDCLRMGQEIVTLDLKSAAGAARLDELLAESDILLTATRPAALARLGVDQATLTARYPRLCCIAIVGYPAPAQERAGHDLTYQASVGLVEPPHFPSIPLADYAGSERAVSAAFALLWQRERTGQGGWAEVSLVEALAPYADALRYGLFAPGTLLGGGSPLYGLYPTRDGWIALAALEPHFRARLQNGLGVSELTGETLAEVFRSRTALEWDAWAAELNIPLAAVTDVRTVYA